LFYKVLLLFYQIMDNYLFLKEDLEILKLSSILGFEKTFFLEKGFVIVSGTTKEILNKVQDAQRRKILTLYIADDEKRLRFILEKTSVDIVMGMEKIFHKDSVHYPKAGLDQILCKIAAEQGKTFGFSLSEILNSKNPGKLMMRMKFNLSLCRKFGVKVILSNFSKDKWEMRSAKDLDAIKRVIEKSTI